MPPLGYRVFRLAILLIATFGTLTGTACNVPVFRYALERWEADPYEIVVFHRAPSTPDQETGIQALEKASADGLANLKVTRVSLSDELPAALRALWEAQVKPTPPWMVVRYPRNLGIEQPVWAGSFDPESVAALLGSAARREIADKLLQGHAVIWLLLETGDKRFNDDLAGLLATESRKLERTLELPQPSPLDPQMRADLPLKVTLTTVRVDRSNPAERLLINMLLHSHTNLAAITETMLFPVFGRGRVLAPAVGKAIHAETLGMMAEFLTGACSCEVKEMNPGLDLLLAANWNAIFGDGEVKVPDLPLVGLSGFVSDSTNAGAAAARRPAAVAAVPAPPGVIPGRGNLARNLVVVLAVGVVCLAAATLVLRARHGRLPR